MNKYSIGRGKPFSNSKHTLKIMRIALFLLFFGILFSQAATGYSQETKLSLNLKSASIKEICDEIEKKSDFRFIFAGNAKKSINKKVNLTANSQNIDEILNDILSNTKLMYKILDNQIVVYQDETKATQKEIDKTVSELTVQQQTTVRGKVIEAGTNEPLPGVSILIENSTRGVTTDVDGTFEIRVNPSDKLVFSFIGMISQTINVQDKTFIDVTMYPMSSELDEVTVVAYGTQKKESVIGAITSVSVNEIKMPVGKISNNLAGQMAGIVSVQQSGEPGVGSNFWIRGVSTFGANSNPLILVDGIERSLDLVDYEDIETFSILKDATATAVYGVRGANGIVLITTKRGKESSKPLINAKVEYGVLSPVVMPKLSNTEQWIDYYNDIVYDNTGRLAFSDL